MTGNTQKALLVPGSFGSDANRYPNGTYVCDRTCYDTMIAHDAIDYAAWAEKDDRVAAVMPWNWGGCAGCKGSRDEIGTQNMPLSRGAWNALF